ncbi:MAG TPA: elongation factor 1-beta [Candidatus Pacearchaeota archaeon]|nr:elongation factor 1-beta [Candidatus Pacearchaeota archaeon]
MGLAIVKMKIMPSSPDSDLGEIQESAKNLLEKNEVTSSKFEKEPIAFGLTAIIIMFGWPEEKPLEELEKNLSEIEGVNSVDVLDMRRAIG